MFVKTDELAATARERSIAMIYAFSRSKTITEITEYEANPENHQVACLRHTERNSPSMSRGIATLILGLAEKGHPNRQRNIFKRLKSAMTKCASHDTFILIAAAITHYLSASWTWTLYPSSLAICEYAFSTICLACLSASCRSLLQISGFPGIVRFFDLVIIVIHFECPVGIHRQRHPPPKIFLIK